MINAITLISHLSFVSYSDIGFCDPALSMAAVVVNELLCYVQNNLLKHPKALVGVAVVGFYHDDEVAAAKQCLYTFVEALTSKPDGLPRLIKRQLGENKRKLDCDDILSMYTALDAAQVVLPQFVAANLQRLPSVSPGEVDIYALAANVASLTKQLERSDKRVDTLSQQLDLLSQKVDSIGHLDSLISSFPPLEKDNGSSWAETAKMSTGSSVVAAKRNVQPVIRLKGAASNAKVKAVPRPKLLKAFVGRLDIDTTNDDLSQLLSDAGVKDVICRKLSAKDGRVFKTAAFYVSCSEESADVFYDESIWPDGAELRDWYTK